MHRSLSLAASELFVNDFFVAKELVNIHVEIISKSTVHFLHLDVLLLLLHIGLSHCLRVHGETECVKIKSGLSVGCNLGVTIVTPVGSPLVLDNPVRFTIRRSFPSEDFEDVLTWESKRVLGASVDSLAVSKHVCEWVQLPKHGSVRHNLLLDSINFGGDAEVHDLVKVV